MDENYTRSRVSRVLWYVLYGRFQIVTTYQGFHLQTGRLGPRNVCTSTYNLKTAVEHWPEKSGATLPQVSTQVWRRFNLVNIDTQMLIRWTKYAQYHLQTAKGKHGSINFIVDFDLQPMEIQWHHVIRTTIFATLTGKTKKTNCWSDLQHSTSKRRWSSSAYVASKAIFFGCQSSSCDRKKLQ